MPSQHEILATSFVPKCLWFDSLRYYLSCSSSLFVMKLYSIIKQMIYIKGTAQTCVVLILLPLPGNAMCNGLI